MHVAVVEDNDLVRQSYERILDAVQLAPNCFSNAETFLEADPDVELVIADLHLPGISGNELLKRLRAEGKSVPFILLSGDFDANQSLVPDPSAKTAFLGKPFSLQKFVDVANQLTGKNLKLPN